MLNDAAKDLLLVLAVFLTAYVLFRLVLYKKRKGGNTALWGTIFEALTHYVQPQETLKEPEQHINKSQKNQAKGTMRRRTFSLIRLCSGHVVVGSPGNAVCSKVFERTAFDNDGFWPQHGCIHGEQ